jgi:hypothetical protein
VLPEIVMCPEHATLKREQVTLERIAESGLPGKMQAFRWDQVQEYRDVAGELVLHADRSTITHEAFQAFQDGLPGGVLGITPWNKTLALRLRALCQPGVNVQTMMIVGPVGSGKSTLVAATVSGLLGRGLACSYLTEANLWAMVRKQWSQVTKKSHRAPDVIQQLVDVPILALDDLGTVESPKPWHVDGMERLICGRYDNGLPILITTNSSLDELADTYGERVGSRLVEMIGRGARYVELGGPDWRTGEVRPDDLEEAPPPTQEPAQARCMVCKSTPCKCECPECGYHPCRGLASCR